MMGNRRFTRIAAIVAALLLTSSGLISGQSRMPEVMDKGSMDEQMEYIQNRTRIYENYRAIREDIFQKMKGNALDTISAGKETIKGLNNKQKELMTTIDNLINDKDRLNNDLENAVKNRDTILFFGARMSKKSYNSLLWAIIGSVLVLAAIVFLLFKRSIAITKVAKQDLEDIKKEFEDFRRVAHENKEKLIVSHFNEIKKLKEMGR